MGKILKALADDYLCNNPINYKGPPEYQKAVDLIYKTAEQLEHKMNDEEKEIFKQYREAQSDASHIYEVERLTCGYVWGLY